MKRLSLKAMKKQMVALGLAAAMVVGMGSPAYARTLSDPGAVGWTYDASEIPTDPYYVDPTLWLGSYDVVVGGYEYQLVISPIPDKGPTCWQVEASRGPDGTGYADAAWTGWFYPDPIYGGSTGNEDGAIMEIKNWNGDKANPDVGFVMGYNPDTDGYFLRAYPMRSISNQKADADTTGIPGEASFAPQSSDPNAATVAYKKISNAYRALTPYTMGDGTTYWIPAGWTTNGTDSVNEPWWTSNSTSSGNGAG